MTTYLCVKYWYSPDVKLMQLNLINLIDVKLMQLSIQNALLGVHVKIIVNGILLLLQ